MSTIARSIPPPAGADVTSTAGSAPGTVDLGCRFAAVAVAIVAGAFVLRLIQLGADSFWIDEINVVSFVRSGHLLTDLRARGGPFEPPLHYLTIWLALHLPLGFETAARVPSVLFGTIEVGALILLARRLTRRDAVALLAGALLAVAPFAIRYSQEARFSVPFSALHLVSWWLLVRALERRQSADFAWWGLALGLVLLTHPFAGFVVAVEVVGAWWWVRREGRAGRLPALRTVLARTRLGVVVALVVALPWFLWGLVRWIPDYAAGRSYALNAPGRERVALDPDLFKRSFGWMLGNSGRITPLVALLVLLAVAAPFVAAGRRRAVAIATGVYALGFFLALVPLAWILRTPMQVRRLEFLLPPVLLLVAIAIDGVGARLRARGGRRSVRLATHLLPLVLVVLSLAATVAYYSTEKTDFRGLARAVRAAGPDDLVVIGPVDERWPPSIRSYLGWQGAHHPVRFIVAGRPLPDLTVPKREVVWITPSSAPEGELRSRALNSVPDLQVIAGDRTAAGGTLAWFVAGTRPGTAKRLATEAREVADLRVVGAPPASTPWWWSLTGR